MKSISSFITEGSTEKQTWFTPGGAPEVELWRVKYLSELEDAAASLLPGDTKSENFVYKNTLDLLDGHWYRLNQYEYEDEETASVQDMISVYEYLLYVDNGLITSVGCKADVLNDLK